MKLSLRYFLLTCLLLGAVGLPWIWRHVHTKRVDALQDELFQMYASGPEWGPDMPSGAVAGKWKFKEYIDWVKAMKRKEAEIREMGAAPFFTTSEMLGRDLDDAP